MSESVREESRLLKPPHFWPWFSISPSAQKPRSLSQSPQQNPRLLSYATRAGSCQVYIQPPLGDQGHCTRQKGRIVAYPGTAGMNESHVPIPHLQMWLGTPGGNCSSSTFRIITLSKTKSPISTDKAIFLGFMHSL